MRFNKLPRDRMGRLLQPGDVVRVVGVPSLKGMSKEGIAESRPVFRYLRGKSVRIEFITEFGMPWLDFAIPVGRYRGLHGVAIEPLLLELLPNTSLERTRGRSASDAGSDVEATARLGHNDSRITKRVYRRLPHRAPALKILDKG